MTRCHHCGQEKAAGLRCPFCGARYEAAPAPGVDEIVKAWDDQMLWEDLKRFPETVVRRNDK